MGFYAELSAFTDRFLASLDAAVVDELARFRQFVVDAQVEEPRSAQEYLIELLALGLFFRLYAGHAMRASGITMAVLTHLFAVRKRFPGLKPIIDAARGVCIPHLLQPAPPSAPFDRQSLTRLLCWLDASGDFREEVERLRHWQRYLATCTPAQVTTLLARAEALAAAFAGEARTTLGGYTGAVESFLQQRHPAYRRREDYLFCGRREAEYHLNMVGAEILNRALRSRFARTARKAVLLPTCMCAPAQGTCRACRHGLAISCTACSADCPVNTLRATLERVGVATFLIPHSSSFSRFLVQWQGQDVGLVGVACVLNLLTGGYEMMKLGIASQCVFLDYCGCRKHWHDDGIPTNLNAAQLLELVTVQPAVRDAP